jgi:hypothetical protein
MPNYCENGLIVTPNTQENLDKFLLASSSMKDGEHQFFDTFLPMPEEMHKDHGWFDWRITHWGTKWDVCELRSDENNIGKTPKQQLYVSFDTAYSPPIQFYEHLESLGFSVSAVYFEPGCGFIGTYANGERLTYDLSPESIKIQAVKDLLDVFGELENYEEQDEEDEENA